MANINIRSSTVTQRIVSAFGANAYEQAVTILVQLIGVPVLIYAWGARTYGEWLMLAAVPAYFSIAGLGLCQSASNDMTARVASGDHLGAAAIYQRLLRVVWAIAGTAILLSGLFLAFAPIGHLVNSSLLEGRFAHLVLWLLIAETLIGQPNGVTHSGFRASGEEARHVSATCTLRLLQNICIWLAALSGGGPIVAAALFFGVRALGTLALAWYLTVRHRWLSAPSILVPGKLGSLAGPAIANLSFPIGQALNVQGMVLVIGSVLGPLSVVAFSTGRTMTRLAVQVVAAITNAVEPELARAHGARDSGLRTKLFLHSVRASLWLALGAAFVLATAGPYLLASWTRNQVASDFRTFGLLLLSAVTSVVWYAGMALLKSANRHLIASFLFLGGSLVSMLMAYVALVTGHDLWMCAASLLLVDILMSVYVIRIATARTGLTVASIARFAFNPIPLLALCKAKLASLVAARSNPACKSR